MDTTKHISLSFARDSIRAVILAVVVEVFA